MGTAAALVWFPLDSLEHLMQKSHLSETKALTLPTDPSAPASTAAPQPKRLIIILSLLSLYTLWGGTYLGMRVALEGFPPFFVAGFRQLLAGIILYIFLRSRGAARPTRAQWLGAAVVGGLLLVI